MSVSIQIILAVALDHWLGEPRRWHPLVGFGRLANALEGRLRNPLYSPARQQAAGIAAAACALLPLAGIWLWLLQAAEPPLRNGLAIVTLYFCIAARSLKQHVADVHQALLAEDLDEARCRVGKIVSRDTEHMSAVDVRRAAIESLLENGADAVFAPLFWFVLAGPAGALLYRLSNTLDAMWGYKTERYRHFGWAAARLDDVLNWLPARLTAASYALLGNRGMAWRCWQTQAQALSSPNAGPVMCAGAGALNLRLGGPARYHGRLTDKIHFGGEAEPQNPDLLRANALLDRALRLWLMLILIGDALA